MNIKLLLSATVFLFLFLFFGCKKDKLKASGVITSIKWKWSITDKNPATNPSPGNGLYYFPSNCERDDIFKFGTDGLLKVNRGNDKCTNNETEIESIPYTLDRTTKRFVINGINYVLAEESVSQIKYYRETPSGSRFNYQIYLLEKL